MSEFKVGDVVRLNSGGLRMTVISKARDGILNLHYSNSTNDGMYWESVPPDCLKPADAPLWRTGVLLLTMCAGWLALLWWFWLPFAGIR